MNNYEIMVKEIELIQSCINRMAHNSFLIKGWTISIVVAVLTIGNGNENLSNCKCVLACCCTIFWYLDAFFLSLERMYRRKYEWVLKNRKETLNYVFDLSPYNDKMWLEDADGKHPKEESAFKVMVSKTLIMYVILIVVIILQID